MKTHGANVGPTRRSKRRSRAKPQQSAIDMSFAAAVNSSLVSDDRKQVRPLDFRPPPLNRASQLGGGHTSPLTTEATMTIPRLPLACIRILEDAPFRPLATRSTQLEGIHEGD